MVKSSDSSSVHSDSTETSFQSCPTPYLSLRSSASDLTLNPQPTAASFLKALQDSTVKQANLNQNSNDKSRKAQPGLPRSVSGTMLSTLDENTSGGNNQRNLKPIRSAQDLQKVPNVPRARKRLESTDSDIIVLDRQESNKSAASDITVLSGSDITICTNPSARPSVTDSDILVLDNGGKQTTAEDSSPASNDITILPEKDVYHSSSEGSSMMGTPTATLAEAEQMMRNGLKNGVMGMKINLHPAASELSPTGSLPTSAVSSMVSSVYENTILDREENNGENVQSIYGSAVEDDEQTRSYMRQNNSVLSFQSALSGSGDISAGSSSLPQGDSSGRGADGGVRSVDNGRGGHVQMTPRGLSPGAGEGGPAGLKYSYDDFKLVDHRLKLYMDMQLFESETEEFSLVLKVRFGYILPYWLN